MRKSEQEKLLEITANKFPKAVYPVLYTGYWIENLVDTYKVENNKLNTNIGTVFHTYYGLQFNQSTLSQITYNNTRNPAELVFIIRYLSGDNDWYLWEYFDNWMKIKNLNTTKI
jgi:hypothetical protein